MILDDWLGGNLEFLQVVRAVSFRWTGSLRSKSVIESKLHACLYLLFISKYLYVANNMEILIYFHKNLLLIRNFLTINTILKEEFTFLFQSILFICTFTIRF